MGPLAGRSYRRSRTFRQSCKKKKSLVAQWRVTKTDKLKSSPFIPLLEEGEADTDGHVVDTQRNRVPLFWRVLSGHIIASNKHSHKSVNSSTMSSM